MTITLSLSPETERKLRELAARHGQTAEEYLRQLVEARALAATGGSGASALLDTEFMQACAEEADERVTLEEVRQALSRIPGTMTEDFIAERDEP